jgi:hypothetical protein
MDLTYNSDPNLNPRGGQNKTDSHYDIPIHLSAS